MRPLAKHLLRQLVFFLLMQVGTATVFLARAHKHECERGRIGNAICIRLVHTPLRRTFNVLYRAFHALL